MERVESESFRLFCPKLVNARRESGLEDSSGASRSCGHPGTWRDACAGWYPVFNERGGFETALRSVHEVLALAPDMADAQELELHAKTRLKAQRQHERAMRHISD